jgi:hypothetical protein
MRITLTEAIFDGALSKGPARRRNLSGREWCV